MTKQQTTVLNCFNSFQYCFVLSSVPCLFFREELHAHRRLYLKKPTQNCEDQQFVQETHLLVFGKDH